MLRCLKMIVLVLVGFAMTTTIHASYLCPVVDNGDDTLTINMTSNHPAIVNRSLFETTYDCKVYAANVTSILMSYNEITSIDEDTFGIFFNLIHLNMSHNNISALHVDTFNRLRTLQELDLSFNMLTQLDAGLIRILSLVSVWFNNNNISYVEPGSVSSENVALMYFNMDNNSLTHLDPWPYLTYQSNARYVDRNFYIRYNNISQITNFMNWTYDLEYRYEVNIFAEYNNILSLSDLTLQQYDESFTSNIAFTIFTTLQLNATNNPYFCDCMLYEFAHNLRTSILRYTRVEEYRYVCNSPSKVAGIDWLHDVDLSELVCNVTDNCPANCDCQDRPHNDTFLVDCRNAGLTTIPDLIPENNRSKIELILDNNSITQLKAVNYLKRIYHISLRNNNIKTLEATVLESLDAAQLDFRDNQIRSLPNKIKKYNYDSVLLHGNPLWCDCDSVWLKDWLTVDNDVIDMSLKCDSDEGTQIISELSLRNLGCTNELLITLLVAAGVVLALIIVGSIFAVRCPYETKVILNKLTCGVFHPSDKYKVDNENDKKEVDIYIVYDDQDEDVVGWVRHFLKKLNSKKPMYSILNPARFMEPGSPAVTIPKWIGKSKRVIVVLSEGIFENKHRNMEIDDAERRLVEAACRKNGNKSQDDEGPIVEETDNQRTNETEINLGEDDNNLMNAPKIIYVKFNTSDLLKTYLHEEKWQLRLADKNDKRGEWQEKLNEEPWKSRMASKRVFSPDERLFWAKLRFELPAEGNGTGPDGNFVPTVPHDDDRDVESDTEHGEPKDHGQKPALYNIQCETNGSIRGKGKTLKGKAGKGQKKRVQPLVDSITEMLEQNRNPKTNGASELRSNKVETSNTDVINKMINPTKKLKSNVNCQNENVQNRINFISMGENNPLAALTHGLAKKSNTPRASNIPYSHHMNKGLPTKSGLLSNNEHFDSHLTNSRCSSATSARSISLSSISKC